MTPRGPLTVDAWNTAKRHGEYLHVLLDGEDVTTACYFADDVAGFVACYVRDADGRICVDPETHDVRRVTRFGRVEIVAERVARDHFGDPDTNGGAVGPS